MDDREIYELMSKFTVGVNESLTNLRVQLQEVATKIDERHMIYDEKNSGIREDMDTAFNRLRKIEEAGAKTSVITSLVTGFLAAGLTAAATRFFVQ
jgi:hypothetical protein